MTGALERLAAAVDAGLGDDRFRELIAADAPREAAVLVLFGPLDDAVGRPVDDLAASDLDVVLQLRAPTLRSHAGEVSFPGGRRDPGDVDLVATALREAAEETGLDPAHASVFGVLPPIPLAASRHLVTPVLARRNSTAPLTATDPGETAVVRRVPVADLLDPANRFTGVFRHPAGEYRGPAFEWHGAVVWGFTALILHELFDAGGWTEPWDPAVEREVRRLKPMPGEPDAG